MLAVVPFRWRLLGALVVAGVGIAVAAGPVFEVYDRASAGETVGPSLTSAGYALLVAALIGLAGGALLSLAERRIKPSDDSRFQIRRVGWGLVGLVVVAVIGAAALNSGRISDGVSDQWNSLRNPGTEFSGSAANPTGSNRLLAADPLERYDYWRVAVDGFRDHPVAGLGLGAFDHAYTTERRYPKPSKYPHNLLLRVAGETGIVGLLLFAALVLAIVAGLLRGIRDAGRGERAISAAALATIAYFAVHGSLDWLEAYPVLTGPVLAMGLMALIARDRDLALAALSTPSAPRERRLPRLPAPAGIGIGVAVAIPWLALRYEERGTKGWREDPEAAYRDLRRATDLNPLATAAPLALGLIAVQRDDVATARTAFQTALEREQSWLPHLQLAFIAHEEGDREESLRQFARAKELAPLEAVLDVAEPLVRSRRPLSAAEATRQVFEQVSAPAARLS
jgi:hypothetical protein